jgi:hypothetical protein
MDGEGEDKTKNKRRDETSDSHTHYVGICTFLLSTEFLLVFIYLWIFSLFFISANFDMLFWVFLFEE